MLGRRLDTREFLLEDAEVGEHLERVVGRFLVQPGDRETCMDDRVFTDLHVRQIGQAHLLGRAAEVDGRHPGTRLVPDVDHLAGDSKAHTPLLSVEGFGAGRDHGLPERQTTVVARQHPMGEYVETVVDNAFRIRRAGVRLTNTPPVSPIVPISGRARAVGRRVRRWPA